MPDYGTAYSLAHPTPPVFSQRQAGTSFLIRVSELPVDDPTGVR